MNYKVYFPLILSSKILNHFTNFVVGKIKKIMSEADRFSDYRLPQKKFYKGALESSTASLVTVNVVFFIILLFLQVGYLFGNHNLQYFYEEVFSKVALTGDGNIFLHHPWTLITYMFADVGAEFWRLLSNMVWLWIFGTLLQQFTGNSKVAPVYIYGGLLGGIVFLIITNLNPTLHQYAANLQLLGANTGVMAVAMAATTLQPKFRFFQQIRGGIPMWVFMIVYVLIDIAGAGGISNPAIFAHLGGALAGFLFVVFLKKDIDLSTWMVKLYHYSTTALTPPERISAPKDKVYYNTSGRAPYNKTAIVTQQRVDELLDKISRHGYSSLNKEEKDFLKKAAEND